MPKNKPVPKKLLLSRLEAWSANHLLEQDPYLNSVRNAITTSAAIDFWSTLDPEENLPRPRAQVGSSRLKAARLVATIRNVSVFLPVGITWKAIGEATTAFAEFTSSTAAAPVNFLEFWQNGFGFLDSKWLIGNVAEIDFWIIVGIVFLTLLATGLQQSGKNLNSKEQLLLDRERQVLVLELKSYFSTPRKVSSAGIDQSMAKALRNLTSATEAIAVAAMNLRQATKVDPEFQQIHSEVHTFYQRLGSILRSSK
jgi:hypothetical protein